MTDTYTGQTTADDIDDAYDTTTQDLDRQADAILIADEASTFADGPSDHASLQEDAAGVRDWGKRRVERLRGAVEDEPMRATLYALGIGVVIGLLAGR